jgi:serine/threonine protein phosphatase PrpC
MDNYNDVKMGIRKLNVAVSVSGEKTKDKGEDSYSYFFNDKGGFVAVFDGYGKSAPYEELGNKTGGYFASRLAADITLQMFKNGNFTFSEMDSIKLGSDMKKYIEKLNKSVGTDERIMLPTTASIVACDYQKNNDIFLEFLWAGNSRGYLLDRQGLCQITEDDVVEKNDPLSDSKDRVINLINGETEFKINNRMLKTDYPVTVVTATDGAFKCFSTPMEFEYALLYTLNRAKSVAQWESLLTRLIGEFAKDDFSLMIASFGFDDFKDLKHYYFERTKFVFDEYISPMSGEQENQDDIVKEMWNKYK